jgi:hypothetical protein
VLSARARQKILVLETKLFKAAEAAKEANKDTKIILLAEK